MTSPSTGRPPRALSWSHAWGWLRALPAADLVPGAALLAGLVLSSVASALTPALLASHVVLLEALSGGVLPLVVGGADARVHAAPLVLVVLAPLLGVLLYDLAYWAAGRRWGLRLLGRLGRARTGRRSRSVQPVDEEHPVLALVQRRGVVVLAVAYYQPVPNALLYAACGASGMSLASFLLGDALGTLLWEALVVSLGWAFGRRAVSTVHALSSHTLLVTVVLVGGVLLVRAARARRGRGGLADGQ